MPAGVLPDDWTAAISRPSHELWPAAVWRGDDGGGAYRSAANAIEDIIEPFPDPCAIFSARPPRTRL